MPILQGRRPYQRIMRAAKAGTGVRLTEDEARQLSRDQAIVQRAEWDDDPDSEQMQAEADRCVRSNS